MDADYRSCSEAAQGRPLPRALSVDPVRPYRGDVFDVEAFLAELVACGAADDARQATHDALARTLSGASGEVAAALAPPDGGITLLHHAP